LVGTRFSKEKDGFHFYMASRLDWLDRRVVETYKMRQTFFSKT
jgi:hypothetical protein